MKKIYLTVIALNMLTLSFGQESFGVKGGASLANISIDAPVNKKPIVGFQFGGMFQARVGEKFFIQPELLYSRKGVEAPSIRFADKHHITLNYINVPILLGYRFSERAALLFGPEIGFLTSAKSNYPGYSYNQTKMYNQFDVGLDLSLAYKPVKRVGVDLRYNYGLTNLGKVYVSDRNYHPTYGARTANRVLQLSVFYLFD